MSDDIVIKSDGSISISLTTKDVIKASASRVIEQKLYASFMDMDPRLITSQKFSTSDEIKEVMADYLYSYFITDQDVNPANIVVNITGTPGTDAVSVVLGYTGTTGNGEFVNVSSDLKYSLNAGALTSADFLPGWLTQPLNKTTIDVVFPLNVTIPTKEVELPLEPYHENDQYSQSAALIRVLLPDQEDTSPESESITIPVFDGRTKYTLSSYLPTTGYARKTRIITSVDAVTSDIDYNITTEYGELVLIVPENSAGQITCTVTVMPALHATTKYVVRGTTANQPVFPLKRHRGKYIAVFPRTLQIGNYIIKYEAITEAL